MPEDKGLTRSEREEKVLQFWKENKIFEKTLRKDSPKGDFIFYEGPPTANGKPGIHHLESRAFKDAIPRYKTMRGYHVPRRAGWDTHGLPVELEVEKKLGLKNKKEIEAYGVERFNEECRKSVLSYIGEWTRFTERIGYWVDLDEAYFTFDSSYMEAVWKVISKANDRGLLYKDYKVVPWCPRCGTALSSHELALGYEDVKDLSLYVKFRLKKNQTLGSKVLGERDAAFFLAWTTTPWTLPGNVALAVGEDIDYAVVARGGETYILAAALTEKLLPDATVLHFAKGRELVGLKYDALYPYLKDLLPQREEEALGRAYAVYAADFVKTDEGTGIVHTAVMYGQDDFVLGTALNLPKFHLVSPDGTFVKDTGFLAGRSVVDESLAVDILKDLEKRGLYFGKENHLHSYPFCWRCHTRLIYYARSSWYIRMSAIRDELVRGNEKIHWEPEYIKEGRFGEWLREVKDWAISRERYWGTPLPIWEAEDGEKMVIDSINSLMAHSASSGNSYFVMRHGQADNNARKVVSVRKANRHHLTPLGRRQVEESAESLKDKHIDIIVASPFLRTRETAELVAVALGLHKSTIVLDPRLGEFDAGDFEGRSEEELHSFFHSRDMWSERCPGGEDFREAKRRLGGAIEDTEERYRDKNILFITHKISAWLLDAAASRLDERESDALDIYLPNAGLIPLYVSPVPHDRDFEIDLHKPYIDKVVLLKDGKEFRRAKEVMDVWLDSGSMPFAQDPGHVEYPADFISEAIDQTRGWFYTLHAVGSLATKDRAFKNAICLGHILDKDGRKMSKSVGNIVEPWGQIEKYGVDALRLWMYSVNQPGESKNYDERTVDEVGKRIFNLLDNVFAFYELYRDRELETNSFPASRHVLDKWILAKLGKLVSEMTGHLEAYKLLEPVRDLRDFVNDLSTWYLRRSRERIKSEDKDARRTLYYVLKTLGKLLAPFAPFAAEELFQKLRTESDPESIHLEAWPSEGRHPSLIAIIHQSPDENLLRSMEKTRSIVSLALEARSRANMKIRQPLARLQVKNLGLSEEYIELIKDEVNVKEVRENARLPGEIHLYTELTPDLIEEGRVREAIRSIQELRKEKGLRPGEMMTLTVPSEEWKFYHKHKESIEAATHTALVTE